MSREAVLELAERAGVDPDELLEWWSERAAVREFDGGQSRADAERGAVDDCKQMLEVGAWVFGPRRGPKSAGSTATDHDVRKTK
ncbi:MAG TPA: hypothetical protein VFQ53_37255 [Kofleriaceae bacterium]|nr:hypothetical protein [Kofleriaceae bacterium]